MHCFKVVDMTCLGCASTITRAIQIAEKGAEVHADLSTKTLHVDSRLAESEIAALIAEAGYRVAQE